MSTEYEELLKMAGDNPIKKLGARVSQVPIVGLLVILLLCLVDLLYCTLKWLKAKWSNSQREKGVQNAIKQGTEQRTNAVEERCTEW